MVLLADPRLSWESKRPLGDRFRPPLSYPDTGLLARWGLTLNAPSDGVGTASRRLGNADVASVSPGQLMRRHGSCRLQPDGFVATCRIGRGTVTVVADADWVMAGEGSVGEESAASNAILLADLIATK